MAVEEFHVIYNAQDAGFGPPCPFLNTTTKGFGQGGNTLTEYSTEEMEKNYGSAEKVFTEKVKTLGNVQKANVVSGEWVSAAVAAKWVRIVLGGEVLGVVAPKKTRLTEKEEAEKPMATVKTTEFKAESAL